MVSSRKYADNTSIFTHLKDKAHWEASRIRSDFPAKLSSANLEGTILGCCVAVHTFNRCNKSVFHIKFHRVQFWLEKVNKSFLSNFKNKILSRLNLLKNFSQIVYGSTSASKSYVVLPKMVDPIIVTISPYMMEFLKRRREFSDLELMKTDENVTEIPASKKPRFDKLKEEMQNITCQSYLLTDNQYEMFQEKKELFFTDMEKNFNVKGNLYRYSDTAEIPVIFRINPLTSISCVMSNFPERIPVDSLITINCNEPTSDCREFMHDKTEDYRLLEYESWDIPMNHHIVIHLTDKWKETYRWSDIFENCLKIVFKNDFNFHTIGISVPKNVYVDLKKFSQSIFMVFQNLLRNHERQIYILLLVASETMKGKIVKNLKKISDSESVSSQEISSDIVNNQFTVDVIEGLITEQKVDVIVSSVNEQLELASGTLSKAILIKAGKQIQAECLRQRKDGLSFPKIAMTYGYKLPTKYVFFGAIPHNSEPNTNISIFIEKCLEKASEINMTSIAFPAVGTGNLKYEPRQVAVQMESAIAKFKAKTQQSSLKEIFIVIYPERTKGKDTLSMFKETFAKFKDSKGAISKTRHEISHPNEWISPQKSDYNHLQWVQFLNYSGQRERLDLAVQHFEQYLLNPSESLPNYSDRVSQFNEESSESIGSNYDSLSDHQNISASQSEVKELLLFYDLPFQIKTNIEEQFEQNLVQHSVLVSESYADQFKTYLNELRTLHHNDTLWVPSRTKSWKLQQHVEKICQEYFPIKCAISSDGKEVLFKDRTFENNQAAKSQMELFLGLRENFSVSQDRFNFSEYESEELKGAQEDQTTYHEPEDRYVSPTVPLNHRPVVKSAYETVSSAHKQFKSVSLTVPSYKKTEESINEFPNISHQQKRISTMAFNSQNKKNIQDNDCFTIGDDFIVKIYQGNILTANVDGIVNAANKYLMHGAGLARAIIKAAGDAVHTEGQAKLVGRKLNDGDVLSTSAGNLMRYSYIIHAVGPMRSHTNTDDYCRMKVAETVCNSLKEASKLGLSSVALPAISSAIFAVPIDVCTDGYFNGVTEFCDRKPASSPLKEVHFVDLNQATCDAIKNHFAQQLGNF